LSRTDVSPQSRRDRRWKCFFCSNREAAIGAETPSLPAAGRPSGIRSNPITDFALIVSVLTERQKTSCLSASPDKQEIVSLRFAVKILFWTSKDLKVTPELFVPKESIICNSPSGLMNQG